MKNTIIAKNITMIILTIVLAAEAMSGTIAYADEIVEVESDLEEELEADNLYQDEVEKAGEFAYPVDYCIDWEILFMA